MTIAKRSLVLDTTHLMRLRIDGPALSIQLHEKSRQWFPVRRLSRILCIGLPPHGYDALMECAAAGVPVTFLSKRGRVLGQLSHPAALPSALTHWLDGVDYEADLALAWDHWLDSIHRHWYAMIGCTQGSLAERASEAQTVLHKFARKEQCMPLLQFSRRWLEGFLTAQISDHCARMGLPLSSQWNERIRVALQPPLASIVQAALLQSWPRARAVDTVNLGRFFHSRMGQQIESRIEQALRTLAAALERCALDHGSG